MKSSSLFTATAILPLMGLLTLSACQGVIFPEEEYTGFPEHQLTVITRSTESLSLPVQVFAFDTEGQLLDSQLASSSDASVSLSLPPGKCKIVATSGTIFGKSPSLQDVVSMPDENYTGDPIILGLADVTMGEKPQTLNVLLAHQVAQLNLTLTDVPQDVTDVQVSVSTPYSQISLQGECQNAKTAEIPCVQSGSEWTTGTVYVLPTAQQQAAFSIRLTFDDREESYSYTYPAALIANTPYIMYGTYAGRVTLNGSFILQDWEKVVENHFQFGPGVSDQMEDQPQNDEKIIVDEIPMPESVWSGHVVVSVTETPSGADLLLLSLQEWEGMTSAFNEDSPNLAQHLVAQYDEKGMKGWHIPTREEAQWMMQSLTDRLDALNALMDGQNGMPMHAIDEKMATVRYLCEDATYSFALLSGSKISKAGAKLDTYHLRLVKKVSVAVQ
ncbi:MAG: FimB/Mfa2 family fimbrial subunit [Bacteroidaceae bacterium]|nr:FimB/Mfa2 family fimbrial subunit [Bacteroidaceae bacterium]